MYSFVFWVVLRGVTMSLPCAELLVRARVCVSLCVCVSGYTKHQLQQAPGTHNSTPTTRNSYTSHLEQHYTKHLEQHNTTPTT